MKVCENCGIEIGTKDGDNRCDRCSYLLKLSGERKQKRHAKEDRKARERILSDLGLVKVKGALGGVYWERISGRRE